MPSGIQAIHGHRKPASRGPEIAHTRAQKQAQAAPVSFWLGVPREGFTAVASEKFTKLSGAEAEMTANIVYANVLKHGGLE